ncbi:MAG: ATP-binding protein [Chloroflexota bacterium]|nr:ATP-binding protein [Chloroflexota bacterium]
MLRFVRRSLLGQLLGVYLLFVAAVLGTGMAVNAAVQTRLRDEVQAQDLALAQAIALDTDDSLRDAGSSLANLAGIAAVRDGDSAAMLPAFTAFKAARKDVDRVFWLDAAGVMRTSVPGDVRTQGVDLKDTPYFRRAGAAAKGAAGPVLEAALVDLTTFNAVVTVALPVHATDGRLTGVVATNLLLDDLGAPLRTVVAEQRRQGHTVMISMVDARGQLIASPERERLLQPALNDLPGAADALSGKQAARLASGPHGQAWLFTSAPVPSSGWAVVVQRPAQEALAVVDTFISWLLFAALLFGLGGLIFWLVLVRRVIRPLHALAGAHQAVLATGSAVRADPTTSLATRLDEVGDLARAFTRLEQDVNTKLTALHTLLETSTTVVGTLDPHTVAEAIIHEVSRLVDVQAAVLRVPDENGYLRALASVGRSPEYELAPLVLPDDPLSPAVRALREGRPVQMVAGGGSEFPDLSYGEGFRALLAIPIISPRVGGVVLLVHRTRPEPFNAMEVDLLLTFANYATLAWEHAVLYERSDVRLREVALENEDLYRRTMEEKQTLEAIVGSISDGLVLTGVDGALLYANMAAREITGMPLVTMGATHISDVHSALRSRAVDPEAYSRARVQAEEGLRGRGPAWLVEICGSGPASRSIQLRLFDVRPPETEGAGQLIGRGLLLRDVTREQEIDRLKTSLLAAVGHEIRTPLAAIKGHASTLLQDDVTWPPEDQRHFLQTISDEADRLAQLMTNLLDLSRYEAGVLPLTRVPVSLSEIVERALAGSTGKVNMHSSGLPRVVVKLEQGLPSVEVDAARIEVVLRNLLANARAYGNGKIEVAAHRQVGPEGMQVLVCVADNGPGLGTDEIAHIFERFYRAPRGLQRRSEGTGLGLAISKAFVEAHGQTIWAESSRAGTRVLFTLPCAQQANGRPEPGFAPGTGGVASMANGYAQAALPEETALPSGMEGH